jgi:hypothetical protein
MVSVLEQGKSILKFLSRAYWYVNVGAKTSVFFLLQKLHTCPEYGNCGSVGRRSRSKGRPHKTTRSERWFVGKGHLFCFLITIEADC